MGVHYSAFADDRVLLDSVCSEVRPFPGHVLAFVAWHCCYACLRLCRETQTVSPFAGFVLGMAGWGFILFEIFAGEAGKIAGTGVSENVKASFGTMRFIVSVGWSIYPLGTSSDTSWVVSQTALLTWSTTLPTL